MRKIRALMNRDKITVKRALDVVGAVGGLVVLSPLLVGTALVVRWKHGSPVLFRQKRPGRYGEPFEILKFRTMTDERDDEGNLLPDEKRLTDVGRFLRQTSLDEFPELINVLKGEMSLVGPRPLRMSYLKYYTDAQMRRHNVKPGVTGWAQINGRNTLTWEEKFELDVWYVDHQSLWLDLKILWKTLWKVIARQDISHQGYATMPKFRGRDTKYDSSKTDNAG